MDAKHLEQREGVKINSKLHEEGETCAPKLLLRDYLDSEKRQKEEESDATVFLHA